jgi:quinoprotein dehydrogenase-associated probable ABC transporter substrate-binding protein
MRRSNRDTSTRSIARSRAHVIAGILGGSALAIGALSYAQTDSKLVASKLPQPTAASPANPVAANPSPSKALKICADPNNLPQSDQNGAGYENELARALARDLGKPLEYTYFPQRMGFVRNTLKHRDDATGEFKCDLIVGVPVGFEPAATTRPYMRSTYALLVPARAHLGTLRDPNDLLRLPKERLQRLRFGVFSKSPATDWLLRNGLIDRATFYAPQSGDVTEHPASIVERDLVSGATDVAIVWGPVAGFLASRHTGPDKWTALPWKPDPEIRFDFEIAMGVRFGEKEWKSTLDRWISEHQSEIDKILSRYQVPLLALSTAQSPSSNQHEEEMIRKP